MGARKEFSDLLKRMDQERLQAISCKFLAKTTSICVKGGEECSSWQMNSGRDGNVNIY